jgi:hypothetical protein
MKEDLVDKKNLDLSQIANSISFFFLAFTQKWNVEVEILELDRVSTSQLSSEVAVVYYKRTCFVTKFRLKNSLISLFNISGKKSLLSYYLLLDDPFE